MARSFNGSSSKLAAITSNWDLNFWWVSAWMYPRGTGAGAAGRLFTVSSNVQAERNLGWYTGGHFQASEQYAITNGIAETDDLNTFNKWYHVVVTGGENSTWPQIYWGDLATPMHEAIYTTHTAPAGTSGQTGTPAPMFIGSSNGSNSFDGVIARVWARVSSSNSITLGQMEALRLGWIPEQDGGSRGLWMLDSPTVTECEDRFALAPGTATNLAVAEDPPIPWGLPGATF